MGLFKIANHEIRKVSIFKYKPLLFHLELTPFFLFYIIWFAFVPTHFEASNATVSSENETASDPISSQTYINPQVDYYLHSVLSIVFLNPEEAEYFLSSISISKIGQFVIVALVAILQILLCLGCYWSISIRTLCTCSRVISLPSAQLVLVTPTPNNGDSELVPLIRTTLPSGQRLVHFTFHKSKFVFDNEQSSFVPLRYPLTEPLGSYLESRGTSSTVDKQLSNEKDQATIVQKKALYGSNQMSFDVPSFMALFTERATAPFFVFQVFCVVLWSLDEMWYYSLLTLGLLVMFECTLVQQQLRNLNEIRKMGNRSYPILVYRDRTWTRVPTEDLLPGDLVSVSRQTDETADADGEDDAQTRANREPTGTHLVPCDLLLLRGSCIIDESLLTGESVIFFQKSTILCSGILNLLKTFDFFLNLTPYIDN